MTARTRAPSTTVPPGPPLGGPVRTCVGCRARAEARDLLRIVVVGGVIVPDPARRLPGRGAHLHRDRKCYDLAVRRKAFSRALKLAGAMPSEAVLEYLTSTAALQSSTAVPSTEALPSIEASPRHHAPAPDSRASTRTTEQSDPPVMPSPTAKADPS